MVKEKKNRYSKFKNVFLKKEKKNDRFSKPGKPGGNISGLKTDKKGERKEEMKPCKVFFFFQNGR